MELAGHEGVLHHPVCRRWRGRRYVCCLLLATVAAGQAEAAEWSAEPAMSVKGEYNSNLIITAGPHQPTYGRWISPSVKFAGSTENLELTGRLAADFVGYTGDIDRSLTNLYFPLSAKYSFDRETVGFDGGFTRDNTLMGELLQTGVVLSFTQRNAWNATPSWRHAFSERLSLDAAYTFSSSTYENGARLGLLDYTVHTGTGGMSYRLTEQDQVQMIGTYTDFRIPEAGRLRSEIVGGQLGYQRDFDQTLSLRVMGGGQIVRSTVRFGPFRLQDSQLIWIGTASLKKQWDNGSLEVSGAREIFPSGFGLLVQTDRIGVTLSRTVSEHLTAALVTNLFWAAGVTEQGTSSFFPRNRFVYVSPKLSWRFNEWWTAEAAYTHADRRVDATAEHGVSHAATLTVTYQPHKFTVGR